MVKARLGSTEKILVKDSKQLDKDVSKYIESKDKKENDPALWPLVRRVSIQCHSEVLRTGATLVDLPGVADSNAARSSIAKRYMKKADCICIVAPITRAVDDKVAKGER